MMSGKDAVMPLASSSPFNMQAQFGTRGSNSVASWIWSFINSSWKLQRNLWMVNLNENFDSAEAAVIWVKR